MTRTRRIARCASCKAPVEWVTSVHGKKMPLDEASGPAGNILVDADGVAHYLGKTLKDALRDHQKAELRTSHHATCPDAQQFRRSK